MSVMMMVVGDDDGVGVQRVEVAAQAQLQLAGVEGAPPPRPRVTREVLGGEGHAPHDRAGATRPARRGLAHLGDLGGVHAAGGLPGAFGCGVDGAPDGGVALGGDGEGRAGLPGGVATWREKRPASARTRGRSSPAGSAATARPISCGATGQGSSSPAVSSATSPTPASAHTAGHGRPQQRPS
jgi:hypothetical protein